MVLNRNTRRLKRHVLALVLQGPIKSGPRSRRGCTAFYSLGIYMDIPLRSTLSLLASEVTSCFILWSILRIAYNFYLHPLSRFPGPPGAACTKLWLAYMEVWKGVNLTDLRFQLHEKYGTWSNSYEQTTCIDLKLEWKATL